MNLLVPRGLTVVQGGKKDLGNWACVVYVHDDYGDVLTVMDRKQKLPLYYKLPGGKQKKGETVLRTAIRELNEETRMIAPQDAMEYCLCVQKDFGHLLFIYRFKFQGSLRMYDGTKGKTGEEVRVVQLVDIPDMDEFHPHHRQYLQDIGIIP